MTHDVVPDHTHAEAQCEGARLFLKVPRAHVKAVKLALESSKLFDRYHGISPDPEDEPSKGPRMRVPTLIPCTKLDQEPHVSISAADRKLLSDLHLEQLTNDITHSAWTPSEPTTRKAGARSQNALRRAIEEAFEDTTLAASILSALDTDSLTSLIDTFPDSYSLYPPLLLLPSTSLPKPLITLISTHPALLVPLWRSLAASFSCTHIALNAPIPASNAASASHAHDKENILRSPVHLTPLYGDFGPVPTPQRLAAPEQNDFENALWVSVVQNGIRQTWAPRYTMFSRGNVKEKARILGLASASLAGDAEGPTATAVDMYAGIGYFSFSYRRAGVRRVVCFELNPWSVEGLRRGAALNGWTTRVFTAADMPTTESGTGTETTAASWTTFRETLANDSSDFLLFATSNAHADKVLTCLRHTLPTVSIRHVNLGLLPVSRASWPSAVRALDRERGGWIHAHENVGVADVDERRREIEAEFQRLVDDEGRGGKVEVEHVERVKMYAPGVVHAVFDVYVPGTVPDS